MEFRAHTFEAGMDQLPFVDEHDQQVGASADAVWTALLDVVRRAVSGGGSIARLLGCDPARGTPEFSGKPGDTCRGFGSSSPSRPVGSRCVGATDSPTTR
jgi:hypothetical protein